VRVFICLDDYFVAYDYKYRLHLSNHLQYSIIGMDKTENGRKLRFFGKELISSFLSWKKNLTFELLIL